MLAWFKRVAFWEGISYLVLLFIAMPMKYFFDSPLAVRYVGMAHGALFVAYILLLVLNWSDRKWSFGKVVLFFLASLVPFGTFWVEKKISEEQATIA